MEEYSMGLKVRNFPPNLKFRDKKPRPVSRSGRFETHAGGRLQVVVEGKLVRMRTELHRFDFLFHFEFDPGLDEVLGEDIPAQKEVMVPLEVLQSLLERAGSRGNLLQFCRTEIINVDVERLARSLFVLGSVQPRRTQGAHHQMGRT